MYGYTRNTVQTETRLARGGRQCLFFYSSRRASPNRSGADEKVHGCDLWVEVLLAGFEELLRTGHDSAADAEVAVDPIPFVMRKTEIWAVRSVDGEQIEWGVGFFGRDVVFAVVKGHASELESKEEFDFGQSAGAAGRRITSQVLSTSNRHPAERRTKIGYEGLG